jgi:hypothetical protein
VLDDAIPHGHRVARGQEYARSGAQDPLHERHHFDIQVHAARESHPGEIGKPCKRRREKWHLQACPGELVLEVDHPAKILVYWRRHESIIAVSAAPGASARSPSS